MTGAVTSTTKPYESNQPIRRDGFVQLLHAEWTKFRTVRGWVIGLVLAAVVTVLLGLLTAAGSHSSCGRDPDCRPPTGPDGETVTDTFSFVHQPLTGDGSITVRVTSLTGLIPSFGDDSPDGVQSGLQEWAKAGIIIKEDTTPGSAYAAIMITADHGVRMQHNYTHDTVGSATVVSADSPLWLRLTRSGDTLTGFESDDGTNWSEVGTARLAGLPSTVQAGMFVASPPYEEFSEGLGEANAIGGPSQATAVFDQVGTQGGLSQDPWAADEMGGGRGGLPSPADEVQELDGTFTVTGAGDIAPNVAGSGGNTVEQSLQGVFAALIVVIVIGTMFITAEYRRGLIRTTLAASPRRGRVLAAKAIVLGLITFVVGLAASAFAFWYVGRMRRDGGEIVVPVSSLTEVRVVVGTAALLAVASVLAMCLGSMLRRSAGAVAIAVVLIVLPYILAVASVLPTAPAQWLLRVTPAAAFAVQQSTPQYAQVVSAYTPAAGYFPLAPLVGFAVLCAWTAAALAIASVLLRRRDA